jgi:ribose 5-phosphate isomerase B
MSKQWTIAIGSDNAGTEYKSTLKADLEKDGRVKSVIDVGVNRGEEDFDTAYPHIGVKAARLVAEGKADRALLICGTGMGVAISANKVVGSLDSRLGDVSKGEGSLICRPE